MKPEIFRGSQTTTQKVELMTLPVEGDLLVFRERVVTTATRGAGELLLPIELGTAATEGFIKSEELGKKLAGLEYRTERRAIFAGPEVAETFRTEGYTAGLKAARGPCQPYTAFAAGTYTAENVLVIDSANNMIRNAAGECLPVAVVFDYATGFFDDAHYDLDIAAKILFERDDVVMWTAYGKPVEKPAHAINEIPSYNVRELRSQHLHFAWRPQVEDYRRAMEISEKEFMGQAMGMAKGVFDLDLLGLRAGGAALYEKFTDSREDVLGDFEEREIRRLGR